MNVNDQSAYYGKMVPWSSLTPEQQASGDWRLLPDGISARDLREAELARIELEDMQASMTRALDRLLEERNAAASKPEASP
jgi:hypothetical protein